MTNSPLYNAARKRLPAGQVDHYMSILTELPEDEWVSPNNKHNDAYAVCLTMSDLQLISVMREPLWINGSPLGVRVSFRYRYDLLLSL